MDVQRIGELLLEDTSEGASNVNFIPHYSGVINLYAYLHHTAKSEAFEGKL